MKTTISETIDGSMKDIIQLKTLDSSLEYSQLFDALDDCPQDFKAKLIGALNSLSQTMGIPATDVFNQVLCASKDENQDVKKKMYNWWRAFFEVLGRLTDGKMPKDRVSEYNGKIDDLMSEIMKSGDASSEEGDVVAESRNPNNSIRFGRGDIVDWDDPDTGERHRGWRVGSVNLDEFELFPPAGGKSVWVNEYYMDKVRKFNEDYEEADKADEDEMNKDFEFAVRHIGEIANKVKDIVNFVNPYCESMGGTSKMNEDEVRDFVKSIGFRLDSDGIDYETQLVDALTGKDTSYNAGWGAVYYNSDKVLQFLKKYGMLGSRGIKQKEAISKLKRLFKSGKWKSPQQDELFNEVDNTMNENEADDLGAKAISKLVWDSQDDEMEVLESYPPNKDGSVKFDVFIKNNGQLGEHVSIDDIVGLAEGVFGDILRGTGWEFEVVPANEDITVEMWNGADFDGKVDVYNDQTRLGDSNGAVFQITCIKANGQFNEVDNTMKKTNERGGSDWVSMDDMIGMEVGESDEEPIHLDDEEKIVIANAKKTAKKDGYDQYILFDKNDNSWAFERKHIQTKEDFAKFGQEVVGIVRAEDLKFVPFELESDDGGKGFWKAIDDVDDLERKGYWSGKFKVGDKVMWNDPEYDEWTDGWTVISAPEDDEDSSSEDDIYTIENDDGSEAEVLGSELRPATTVNEASVVVDANDVWDVLDLLDDPDANKNLTDLINSHVRTEEEIMDAIDSRFGEESPTKVELNDAIRDFWWIVSALDLDVEQFKKDGSFVDPEKPVALESDDALLKVGDKVKVVGKGLASKGWVGEISSVDKEKKGLPYTVTFADREPGEYAKDEVELVQEKDETPPDEVKDGEKKYKQDGETKTLDFGENKKPVCEMTIEQEVTDPWKLLELLWGQGQENFRDLLESELIDDDTLMMMLEDMEIKNLTSINDAFAYDFPSMLDMLGLDGKAWSQNLVIKRKED